jgi:hypothetical protein
MLRFVTNLACLILLFGCTGTSRIDYSQTPIAVAPVERQVARSEIIAAVQREVADAPVCIPIPQASWEPQTPFTVRFGPSKWNGQTVRSDIGDRLGDFVQMGFWTREDIPSNEGRLARYHFTELGERYYRGHPFQPRGQASFCVPGERRLVRIVNMTRIRGYRPHRFELGFYPPEALNVRFEWIGAEAPSWLPTPALLERYRAVMPSSAHTSLGSVLLFRVWRRDENPMENAPHSGTLEPYCYDNVHNLPMWCGPHFD